MSESTIVEIWIDADMLASPCDKEIELLTAAFPDLIQLIQISDESDED